MVMALAIMVGIGTNDTTTTTEVRIEAALAVVVVALEAAETTKKGEQARACRSSLWKVSTNNLNVLDDQCQFPHF